MSQTQAQKRLRQRKAMVEPVFSHLRIRQNLNRFRRKGLLGVKIEFALHIMAYNISRAIARCYPLAGSRFYSTIKLFYWSIACTQWTAKINFNNRNETT
ncbi:hypothetical protein Lsha_2380 [Legionella shakespearei DSM 23087]|uniref:Transposase DDE domain-containing protein n=1 Tax=Legionella shakespearei DSM 23087 TaxID=1122169 RepID=A0A0W0YLS1_9GAMM|nr:hypothetical protein Lsha_2380 [Legionella shakespearei DSM 23087]